MGEGAGVDSLVVSKAQAITGSTPFGELIASRPTAVVIRGTA